MANEATLDALEKQMDGEGEAETPEVDTTEEEQTEEEEQTYAGKSAEELVEIIEQNQLEARRKIVEQGEELRQLRQQREQAQPETTVPAQVDADAARFNRIRTKAQTIYDRKVARGAPTDSEYDHSTWEYALDTAEAIIDELMPMEAVIQQQNLYVQQGLAPVLMERKAAELLGDRQDVTAKEAVQALTSHLPFDIAAIDGLPPEMQANLLNMAADAALGKKARGGNGQQQTQVRIRANALPAPHTLTGDQVTTRKSDRQDPRLNDEIAKWRGRIDLPDDQLADLATYRLSLGESE